ncbi:HSP20-like chaperone [Neocallimastix lanati (nom. inval.)]|uniref:HSP20-like chaperone n=1 Tax=Neocallimastix californiae TaxID=1754190 RepID=A0A1Y2ALK6_9FUNG|nr:HSP20-like chaperone [Neocallimastix sp. JGI-2020a]ORY23386.1 HSP20-like chaperone [Neocallimastix californiae]|eukprot:ORY23386.1 HSP20-like chaperone [Neocallimastix californiae]
MSFYFYDTPYKKNFHSFLNNSILNSPNYGNGYDRKYNDGYRYGNFGNINQKNPMTSSPTSLFKYTFFHPNEANKLTSPITTLQKSSCQKNNTNQNKISNNKSLSSKSSTTTSPKTSTSVPSSPKSSSTPSLKTNTLVVPPSQKSLIQNLTSKLTPNPKNLRSKFSQNSYLKQNLPATNSTSESNHPEPFVSSQHLLLPNKRSPSEQVMPTDLINSSPKSFLKQFSTPNPYSSSFSSSHPYLNTNSMIGFRPKSDLYEDDKAFYIHLDLPGMARDQIHIELLEIHGDRTLYISGVKQFYQNPSSSTLSTSSSSSSLSTSLSPSPSSIPSNSSRFYPNGENLKISKLGCEFGKFFRSFSIPESTNLEKIEARMENGALEVILPKMELPKHERRIIEVK